MKSIETSIQTRKINRNSKKRRTTPHKSSNQKKIQKTINSKHFDPKKGLHMAHSMKKTKIYKTTLKTPYSHKKHQFWTQNSHKTHKTATKQPETARNSHIYTESTGFYTEQTQIRARIHTIHTIHTEQTQIGGPIRDAYIHTIHTIHTLCTIAHELHPPNCTLINSSFGTRIGTSIWGSKWDA